MVAATRYEDKLERHAGHAHRRREVLVDSRRATVRLQESAVGNLIADAIRELTKTDAALTNGGGIRG